MNSFGGHAQAAASEAPSGDMALRMEKAFGVKMDTLMRMQASYDIARTRQRESKIKVKRRQAEELRVHSR